MFLFQHGLHIKMEKFYLVFIQSLWNAACHLVTRHISVWTRHTWRAWEPCVARGHCAGQRSSSPCLSRGLRLPFTWLTQLLPIGRLVPQDICTACSSAFLALSPITAQMPFPPLLVFTYVAIPLTLKPEHFRFWRSQFLLPASIFSP